MTWFRLDDGWLRHPKMRAAGLHGRALWIALGTYSAGQETDGHIPKSMLPALAAEAEVKPAVIRTLVDIGLIDATPNGWTIHDWLDYQPSRAEIASSRERKAEAGRKGAKKRWHPPSDSDSTSHSTSHSKPMALTRPVLGSNQTTTDSSSTEPSSSSVENLVDQAISIYAHTQPPPPGGYRNGKARYVSGIAANTKNEHGPMLAALAATTPNCTADWLASRLEKPSPTTRPPAPVGAVVRTPEQQAESDRRALELAGINDDEETT